MPSSSSGLLDYLADIPDPRIERCRAHRLIDILMIAVCGSICGADNWVAIAEFGRAKTDWLKTFLALPNGIPSHDTFGRVLARISPWHFQDCFTAWVQSLMPKLADEGEIVPLDGKTLRRSYDTGSGQAAIHRVHAWAVKNRLVLGQFHGEEALEEISIIPELLRVLGLKGCLVTTDALGCHIAVLNDLRGFGFFLSCFYVFSCLFFFRSVFYGFGFVFIGVYREQSRRPRTETGVSGSDDALGA